MPNRLADETSPYLLQHAENPVDWYPWGPEAFQAAQKQDKPIFLSIGYAACHWCHVMAHESFEDDNTAALMNKYFINVKVDREERPDVDTIYMDAVVAMTGQGGWPMTVFLAPDLKPFFAGTYFPPEDRSGRPGFLTILNSVAAFYKEKREKVESYSEQVATVLQQMADFQVSEGSLSPDLLDGARKSVGIPRRPSPRGTGRGCRQGPGGPADVRGRQHIQQAPGAGSPE